jgi:hypothetical protein
MKIDGVESPFTPRRNLEFQLDHQGFLRSHLL